MSQITHPGSKDLLYHRMLSAVISSLLLHSFLTTLILLSFHLSPLKPLSWPSETLTLLTSFRTLFHYLILTTIIILQGIICSKNYLTPAPSSTTRFSLFCSLFTPHNFSLGALHVTIGVILVYLTLSFESSPYSSVTKSCRNISGTCLVEENTFFVTSGLFTGIYHFITTNFFTPRRLHFPIIPQTKFTQVKREISRLIPTAMKDTIWPSLYFISMYFTLGSYIRTFTTSILFLNTEDEGLDKISRLMDPTLLLHVWIFSFLFNLMMNIMHLMFQIHLTEWMPFNITSIYDEKTSITLPEALGMHQVPIIQHLGYLDLFTLSQKQKSRRLTIFSLSQPGGHPYNWNCVLEKCLGLITGFTKKIEDVCSVKSEVLEEVKRVASGLERPYGFHMRNLVRKVDVPGDADLPKPVETSGQVILEVFKKKKESFVKFLMSKPLVFYFFGVRNERKMQNLVNDGQAIIWAVEAISQLAVVSLQEDAYGIVQKDLGKIVEGLVGVKVALEKLQKVNLLMRKPQDDDKDVKKVLGGLKSAVRRSVYRIVVGFKEYFGDLGLEDGVKEQLQGFFSFRE